MISIAEATQIVRANIPEGTINASIAWEDKWLFSVFTSDPEEGEFDPFYAVDATTGEFAGFSIVGDQDTNGIIDAFNERLAHADMVDDFLAHYGVKGMKWGVRKDRDTGSGSSSGRKSGGPSELSKAAEKNLNTIKPMAAMFIPTANVRSKVVNVGMQALQGVDLKVAAKAAAYDSPLAIAGYAVSALDSGAYRVPAVAINNAVRGGWPKNKTLAQTNMSMADIQKKVVSGVNKDFPGLGTTNNCLRCTYTYEMRRRGYDVAATKTLMATGQTKNTGRLMTKSIHGGIGIKASKKPKGIFNKIFRDGPTPADVFNTLAKQPERSRGDLQMRWGPFMGGHSVAYEIIGGKPVVFDTQSGKTYSTPKELAALTGRAQSLSFNRLDNKNLNQTALTAWVKDHKR